MVRMKFETLYNGEKIPRLGLGTWNMGGGIAPDPSQDRPVKEAIRAALELGYTHIDTSEMYAGGHTEELIGEVIRDFKREDLFLGSKVWDSHLRYDDVLKAAEGSLRRLGVDTLNLYEIHWPNESVPMEETFRALNKLVKDGKVRHLGVSNFHLEQLKQARSLSETPLATNQVPYSLSVRKYVTNGVLKYCQENGILVTAYTPIDKANVLEDPQVQLVARRHGATPVQVALAWLLHQPKVIAIPMSKNPEHLKSNLEALEIELFPDDVELLNRIEIPEGSIWPGQK